jgi:hypothetical protein
MPFLSITAITPFPIYPVLLAGVTAATLLVIFLRRRRKSPEEIEQERRVFVSSIGRITVGNVVDVREVNDNGDGQAQFIIYQYDVAGVSYEASQDVTYLKPLVNLQSCRLGVPTSVKYDPHNPSNSIVVSESWSGLRHN